jgi:hypothetical protein
LYAPTWRASWQQVFPLLHQLGQVVFVAGEGHLLSELLHGQRTGPTHEPPAHLTVLQQLNLLQEQALLDAHELLQPEVKEATAHLPQLFLPPLLQ